MIKSTNNTCAFMEHFNKKKYYMYDSLKLHHSNNICTRNSLNAKLAN